MSNQTQTPKKIGRIRFCQYGWYYPENDVASSISSSSAYMADIDKTCILLECKKRFYGCECKKSEKCVATLAWRAHDGWHVLSTRMHYVEGMVYQDATGTWRLAVWGKHDDEDEWDWDWDPEDPGIEVVSVCHCRFPDWDWLFDLAHRLGSFNKLLDAIELGEPEVHDEIRRHGRTTRDVEDFISAGNFVDLRRADLGSISELIG